MCERREFQTCKKWVGEGGGGGGEGAVYDTILIIARNYKPKEVCDWPVATHVPDLS